MTIESYTAKIISRELKILSKEYQRILISASSRNRPSYHPSIKPAMDKIVELMVELEKDLNTVIEIKQLGIEL